jgi:hypothetical protein
MAAQVGIFRFIHDTHTALAELRSYVVMRDSFTQQLKPPGQGNDEKLSWWDAHSITRPRTRQY